MPITAVFLLFPPLPYQVLREGLTAKLEVTSKKLLRRCWGADVAVVAAAAVLALHGKLDITLAAIEPISLRKACDGLRQIILILVLGLVDGGERLLSLLIVACGRYIGRRHRIHVIYLFCSS